MQMARGPGYRLRGFNGQKRRVAVPGGRLLAAGRRLDISSLTSTAGRHSATSLIPLQPRRPEQLEAAGASALHLFAPTFFNFFTSSYANNPLTTCASALTLHFSPVYIYTSYSKKKKESCSRQPPNLSPTSLDHHHHISCILRRSLLNRYHPPHLLHALTMLLTAFSTAVVALAAMAPSVGAFPMPGWGQPQPRYTPPSLSRLAGMMPKSTLTAPDGLQLKFVGLGLGTQNYTCDMANATAVPGTTGAIGKSMSITLLVTLL